MVGERRDDLPLFTCSNVLHIYRQPRLLVSQSPTETAQLVFPSSAF